MFSRLLLRIRPSRLKVFVMLLILMVVVSLQNYLLFHTVAEVFVIAVSFYIFTLSKDTFQFSQDSFFLFLGILYFFIGLINIFHLAAYHGLGIFPGFTQNQPTQLWIGERYIEAVSLFISPAFIDRKFSYKKAFAIYLLISTAILTLIIFTNYFPDCFNPEKGLTNFKVNSEYIISAILAASLFRFRLARKIMNEAIYNTMVWVIILDIITELIFTKYLSVYSLINASGHILRLISVYLMYNQIVRHGLLRPYDIIFRKLKSDYDKISQIDQYKSEFVGNITHDMKTPLTIITAYGQELYSEKAGRLNDTQKNSVYSILTSASQLSNLVNNFLDYARLDSLGKSILALKVINIQALTKTVANGMGSIARHKKVKLVTTISDTEPIIADENLIERVLQNLLDNAIKFSEPDDLVEFSVYSTQTPCEGVVFKVSDEGAGIPQMLKDSIFKRFFQGEFSIQDKYSGVGLGLTVAQRIVELHCGRIEVDSEEGHGSTFTVFLPAYPRLDEDFE